MLEYNDFLKFIPELPSEDYYNSIVSQLPEPIDYLFNNENFEHEWDNLEEWFIRNGIISEYPSIDLDSVNIDNKTISLCDAENLDELNDLSKYLSKYDWTIEEIDKWIEDLNDIRDNNNIKEAIITILDKLSKDELKKTLDYVNKGLCSQSCC